MALGPIPIKTTAATLLAAAVVGMAATPSGAQPQRVVSMNVCTDQLAMLIAEEGQLHSVSYLASDPGTSALADEAGRYVVNHGLAEEIFLMRPDLVIAGTFTTRATVELLRRLGFRVEEFAPESSFDDVRANIARMGDLLGRQDRASDLVAEIDAGLAALQADAPEGRTVALYYANSYTAGAGTLADAAVAAAGLSNLGETLGIAGTAMLPLELLVLAEPDLVAGGDLRYDAPALAYQNFSHPAYKALAAKAGVVSLPGKYTVCGAPFTLEAARMLQDAARNTPDRPR